MREWVCVLATKPRDKEMSLLMREGYTKLTGWPPRNAEVNRVVLWPNIDKRSYLRDQRVTFLDALDSMYEAHGWTIYADELGYMISELKLEGPFRMLWQQGRSIGLTLVASMQRPRHVPLLAYSQASHVFFWRANDEYDLKRIGGIGSINSREIQHIVSELPGPPAAEFSKQECCAFLYINTRSGKMCVSRVEL